MINNKEACKIADRHLKKISPPGDNYVWQLPDSKETENGWVFEYIFTCKKKIPSEKWDFFGGAPAFFVSKETGDVRDLEWSEFDSL